MPLALYLYGSVQNLSTSDLISKLLQSFQLAMKPKIAKFENVKGLLKD